MALSQSGKQWKQGSMSFFSLIVLQCVLLYILYGSVSRPESPRVSVRTKVETFEDVFLDSKQNIEIFK